MDTSSMVGDGVNRDSLVKNLGKVLRTNDISGAVIEGDKGSGKRKTIESTVATESYAGPVYRLAGTRYGQEIEFGALHFLLVDLQDEQVLSPVVVFSELRRSFEGLADRPLFIVENIAYIDPLSITTLSQLVQADIVKIFVIDDREQALNEDICALVRSEVLEHWRLLPLTFDETERRVSASTGLTPSSLATATLWTYSEGNEEWLEALIFDGLEQGNLISAADSLLVADDGTYVGTRMLELVRTWMEKFSPNQRQVLAEVALQGILAPGGLEPEQLAEMDPLHENGILEFVHEPMTGIRFASRMLNDSLRIMLTGDLPTRSNTQADTLGSFGIALDDAQTLVTQQVLDSRFRKQVEEFLEKGMYKRALELVSRERSRIYEELPSGSGERNSSSNPKGYEFIFLAFELRIALLVGDLELAGCLVTAMDPILLDFNLDNLPSHEVHRAAAALLEGLVRCNRESEASTLAAWLRDVCLQRYSQGADHAFEPCFSHSIRTLMVAFLTLGDWDSCRDLVTWVLSRQLGDPNIISFAKIVEGILEAVAGDIETARIRLAATERQLALNGSCDDQKAVRGILAYCHAATGNLNDAMQFVPVASSAKPSRSNFGWVPQFFWILAIAKIHSHESALRKLKLLLSEDSNQSGSIFRLHAFALLLRLGDLNAASQLMAACQGSPNIYVNAYELLAEGIIENKSTLITQSLQKLIDLGFAEYAAEPENHLYRLISPSQKRMIARTRIHSESTILFNDEEDDTKLDQIRIFELLTKRERFVAAAAARGLSNLEIADKASVSVRTVEGHLYQVYSKLTIQGRAELHSLAASLLRKPADSRV